MSIRYTKKEEIWNTWSHAGGAVMAGAVGIAFIIVVCLGNMDRMWAGIGVGLYLLGMTGSYLASTIYHALKLRNPWRERMRKWDHAAIYWHIAGSYSPITLMAMRDHGMWGWMLFTFVWSCAIIGTVISFIKLKDHSNIETACFCIMGLSVLVAFKPLLDTVHGCRVLFVQQDEIHAYRIPFLCPRRQHLPYRCRLGHPYSRHFLNKQNITYENN